MNTHNKLVKKAQALSAPAFSSPALSLKAQLKKVAIYSSSLVLILAAVFYSMQATAETNATGVEIELIDESTASAIVGDPVQDLLVDIDANTNQNAESDNDLWARIKDGYAMPNVQSQYATNHEAWYASRPDYVKRMVERSQKYLFHIVEEVQKRGMPTEIALLPMIESAFNPQAYSTSKASGIWQFIPSTGKHFGLKQNWWVDNRRDVTAATNAALDYLQKLHSMFGAWDLALAAYNAGEGTVQRAIDKNRRQGLPTNYESLSLPPETKNYVPKLQAIKNIVTEPEKYGLKIGAIPNRPYFARVTTPKQIDAKLAAQLAEISYEEFSALNPSYNRPVITATGEKNQLLLPVWAAERFVTNLANYDKPLTSWRTYQAKRGERMDNIASKFGMNVSQLRDVNSLPATNKISSARPVLVPAAYQPVAIDESQTIDADALESNNTEDTVDADEPKAISHVIHKVKKGETLLALAKQYNTSTKDLIKLNRLSNSKVKVGQTLTVKAAETFKLVSITKNSRKAMSNSGNGNKSTGSKIINVNNKKSQSSKRTFRSKAKANHHFNAQTRIRLR